MLPEARIFLHSHKVCVFELSFCDLLTTGNLYFPHIIRLTTFQFLQNRPSAKNARFFCLRRLAYPGDNLRHDKRFLRFFLQRIPVTLSRFLGMKSDYRILCSRVESPKKALEEINVIHVETD